MNLNVLKYRQLCTKDRIVINGPRLVCEYCAFFSSALRFFLFSFFFLIIPYLLSFFFFFFNDTATTEIYTLSLHDALPIFIVHGGVAARDRLELVEEVQHDFAQRHLI